MLTPFSFYPTISSLQTPTTLTFSKRSGLGIGSLCRLASCSRVRSMFLSFRRTYQSLCKSSLLLFLNCWQVHEAPDFTFSSPQFFGSSKNSSSPLLDNVVWSNLHWWKDVTFGVFLVNRLRENLQLNIYEQVIKVSWHLDFIDNKWNHFLIYNVKKPT